MNCPLCGCEMPTHQSCSGCPLGNCSLLKCPNCNYQIPGESKLVNFIKNIGRLR